MLLIIWIMQKNRGYNNTAYVYRQGARPSLLAKETEEIEAVESAFRRLCFLGLVAERLFYW